MVSRSLSNVTDFIFVAPKSGFDVEAWSKKAESGSRTFGLFQYPIVPEPRLSDTRQPPLRAAVSLPVSTARQRSFREHYARISPA